jgi:glutamate carboxypeptidase
MASLDGALLWVLEQQAEMERLLAELVSQNSYTQNAAGVRLCQERFRERLERIPLETALHDGGPFGPHLTFATEAIKRDRGPLLIGHMDTVFPPGTFEGYRASEGVARGPGVLDMKGGLVVLAFALEALAREGRLAAIPIQGIIVSDEEAGSPDSRTLLRRLCSRADCGLCFESGRAGDLIITRRKGTGAFRVLAVGKAAHAGNLHHEGVNAVWALAKFVDRAQGLTDYARGITVNVGKIEGGDARNTVPDRAMADVDFRFHTLADAGAVEEALRSCAVEVERAVPGARMTLTGGRARPPLERTAESAALKEVYAECQRASGLGDGEAPLLGGGSDAATTAEAGVPSIDGLGPRGAGFHTVEERIELETLPRKAQALVRFLWNRAKDVS